MHNDAKTIVRRNMHYNMASFIVILIVVNLGFHWYGAIAASICGICLIVINYYRLFCVKIDGFNPKKHFIIETICIAIAMFFYLAINDGSILYFFIGQHEGKPIFSVNFGAMILAILFQGIPNVFSYKKMFADKRVIEYKNARKNKSVF